jgi:two-component system phosphate regulon response regulator PhoB
MAKDMQDVIEGRCSPARAAAAPAAARVLVVEDEAALSMLLSYNLEAEGFTVDRIERGDEAEIRLSETVPDLVILDWMLPGVSGLEICRRMRARETTRSLPVIMLTARGEESERVRGLAIGADDYVVKPVHMGPTEFRLLDHLMGKPGRVFSRAQLLDSVWGLSAEIDERTVDVHIGRLRKALSKEAEKDPIRTVRGAGYAFDETFGRIR